jgi:hypothetical protein
MNEGGGKRAERRKEGRGGKKERKRCALSADSCQPVRTRTRIPNDPSLVRFISDMCRSNSTRDPRSRTRTRLRTRHPQNVSVRTSRCPLDIRHAYGARNPSRPQTSPLRTLHCSNLHPNPSSSPSLAPNQALGTPPHPPRAPSPGNGKKKKQNGAPEPVPSTSERRTERSKQIQTRRGYEARAYKMTSRVCPPLQKRPESSFDNRGRQCCNHHGAPMDTLWRGRWLHGDTHATISQINKSNHRRAEPVVH